MATNSNRFPLQSAIKKILDDPNSRPALPALEDGSIVGDGNFGKGDRYDTGKWSDIAVNNGNVVVEVHNTTDSKSLYYRVGKVNGGKIDWGESHYYDKGVRPSVAINNNGLVVEVHKSQGLKNTFWHRLGQVEGGIIKWRNNDKSTEYGVGLEPSVAITDDELVVEVHQSIIHDDGSGQLYYHVGKVKGDTIDWGKSHYYDNGVQPSVAITNDELVVEVHTSQNFNTLYYHVGKVKGDNTIDWGKSHYYNDGVHPSVAITNDRLVVEVHQSQSHNTLWYRGTGKVNNNTIDGWDDKKKSQNYGDGTTPRVACNGRVAVETHSGADNQLLSSVLTLPAFRGKWIELHGDNSYCYCACNSATDNKHRHASSHTMNVKAGAPYFYAVLTKDDDTVDFPTGAVLTIEGPDGTKYDRDIQEENQLVIMSGSSVRCLIVKDPQPGDWKMTMTVPEGVGFHCECNTVPSKDPYKTITATLSKTNQLQKRGSSNSLWGWVGMAAVTVVFAGVGFYIGGPLGASVGARFGGQLGAAVGVGLSAWLFSQSDEKVSDAADDLHLLAKTNSTAATGKILLLDANADEETQITYLARKSGLYEWVNASKYAEKYTSRVGEQDVRSNVQIDLKDPSVIYCTTSGHGSITAMKGWGPGKPQPAILQIGNYEPAEAKNKIFHFQSCCCGYLGGKPDSTNLCITTVTDPALSGLGADLVKNGAKAFFGYKKPYFVIRGNNRWQRIVGRCDVEIDIRLLSGDTAEEAYNAAIAKYQKALKNFSSDDAAPDVVLGALKQNMENLVAPSTNPAFGDKNAKL
jgi:hypothetical protein